VICKKMAQIIEIEALIHSSEAFKVATAIELQAE
jgi:hypothetical protein